MSVFDKIIAKEIPAKIVFEDDTALAFWDIAPQAPVHILVIPKAPVVSMAHLESLGEKKQHILGHLMLVAAQVAAEQNLQGYRLVVNTGDEGGQTVDHLHIHILGGRKMTWPPG